MYSTFQSHEPEFDYLKSLEIEEKINKIRWLKRKNPAHFLLSTNDKTIKLWKVSERDKRVEGYNTKEENGTIRDPACITALRVRNSELYTYFILDLLSNLLYQMRDDKSNFLNYFEKGINCTKCLISVYCVLPRYICRCQP